MRCVLILGGPDKGWMAAPPILDKEDFLVACDGGYPAAVEIGWKPQVAVGDFDTYHGTFVAATQVIAAAPEKDDTDAILGARVGLERGFRDFLILGAFGGRLDHTVANLQMLAFLQAQGASGQLYAPDNRVWLVCDGTLSLPRMAGWHLSVFAWGGTCKGVCLESVRYPLQDASLSPAFPLGVSNEFDDAYARITVGEGTLLVIASKEAEV